MAGKGRRDETHPVAVVEVWDEQVMHPLAIAVPDLSEPDDEMRSLYTRCCTDLFEVRDLLKSGEIG